MLHMTANSHPVAGSAGFPYSRSLQYFKLSALHPRCKISPIITITVFCAQLTIKSGFLIFTFQVTTGTEIQLSKL